MMLAKALEQIGEYQSYKQAIFRIVETQEYAATTGLVDDLDEQSLLEALLDNVKPPYKENTQSRHYLISTPFRYPPLQYGSRFGSVIMPSYFYASEDTQTALSECAFYRFAFLNDINVLYHKAVISEHMSFSVNVATTTMSDLTHVIDQDIISQLISTSSYAFTQQLGRTLVETGTTIIRFTSARATIGVNLALTHPNEIISLTPENNINWICQMTNEKVSFAAPGQQTKTFEKQQFLVDEKLPRLI